MTNKALSILLPACRLIIGLTLVLSGIIKSNDPLGFSYKLEEYFVVFEGSSGLPFTALSSLALIFSIFICALEVFIGAAVLMGTGMRRLAWALLLLILFFTWLTGFSAVTGKVTDCGCFGDAVPLTPWQSFYKDLAMLALILVIFFKKSQIRPVLSGRTAGILTSAAGILTAGFSLYCYRHLPAVDFLPYREGNNLVTLMNDGIPDVYETTLVYRNKKTGEEKEFAVKNIPPAGEWDWKETKNKVIKQGRLPSIHDLSVSDADGNDFTGDILEREGYHFIVVAYDVARSGTRSFETLNKLASDADAGGAGFVALTASPYESADPFRHEVQASFPFYYADATTLKTMIRSNPGLILMKNGSVVKKWHYNDIPAWSEVHEKYLR